MNIMNERLENIISKLTLTQLEGSLLKAKAKEIIIPDEVFIIIKEEEKKYENI